MAPVRHLRRIQDTQLEYILLRHCLCTKPVHLTQLGKTASVRGGARAPGPSPHISGSVDGNNGSRGMCDHRNAHTRARMHCTGASAGWFTDDNDGFVPVPMSVSVSMSVPVPVLAPGPTCRHNHDLNWPGGDHVEHRPCIGHADPGQGRESAPEPKGKAKT